MQYISSKTNTKRGERKKRQLSPPLMIYSSYLCTQTDFRTLSRPLPCYFYLYTFYRVCHFLYLSRIDCHQTKSEVFPKYSYTQNPLFVNSLVLHILYRREQEDVSMRDKAGSCERIHISGMCTQLQISHTGCQFAYLFLCLIGIQHCICACQ